VARLADPPAQGAQIVVVRFICAGSEGCAGAVKGGEEGGSLSVTVDGELMWTADCAAPGGCDAHALGEGPTIAFVTEAPSEHEIRLVVSPQVSWPIAGAEVEWRGVPDLIQGIAYSPFRDCQNPNWGPFPTEDQIWDDLLRLRHMGNTIRTYASSGIQGAIPAWARQVGLRVIPGADLGRDEEENDLEIRSLITLTQEVALDSVIVGNEVLLRGDMSEEELIAYIERVKASVDVPVTTAEIGSTLLQHPRVVDAADYYLVHLYAFWDGIPIEQAARHVVDQYHYIQAQAGGKRVIIGETGWPSAGPPRGDAVPSPENQRRFFREFLTLAQQESVEFLYFAAFDELWKTEGGVGPYWGIMHSDRRTKYDLQSVFVPLDDVPAAWVPVTAVPTASPGPMPAEGEIFPVYTTYAAWDNHFTPSGWMGDLQAIHFGDCARLSEDWEDRSIETGYAPAPGDTEGWAGIYWLEPENNWGTHPGGYDLSGYSQLRFRARSVAGKGAVKFFVGGVAEGGFPSSMEKPIYAQEAGGKGFVWLTTEWQEFHIDLRNADLSRVIDGFGWVAERDRTPKGISFYLDDLVFDRQPPPARPVSRPAPTPTPTPIPGQLVIYSGPALSEGFDLGLDTSGHVFGWLIDRQGQMEMAYPPDQDWGVVYITVGAPAPAGQRKARDLSQYQTLSVEMRGGQGGEVVSIGIKDSEDPDTGQETKLPVTVTDAWRTYSFPLAGFVTADLTRVHIPIEFVFEGIGPRTVYFRNVRYLSQP
jgi:exo-beta-1,3-glucanase (GH17 family)